MSKQREGMWEHQIVFELVQKVVGYQLYLIPTSMNMVTSSSCACIHVSVSVSVEGFFFFLTVCFGVVFVAVAPSKN